jgi:ubiquinone/menaquinone biosynthesis C-methylase UbiE
VARIDFDEIAGDYEAGRAVSMPGLDEWRNALTKYLPPEGGLPILDVGSGTGLFATALAEWFDADVIGVEPSAAMLAEARANRTHPRVTYVAGRAERLPLADRSAGAAWLSTVIHHIGDLPQAARELGRVLDERAPVLIRGAFPGRAEGITLFRFFPSAQRVIDTYPSVEATAQAFVAAGYELAALHPVPQMSASNLSEFRRRVERRADTTLRLIADAEFDAGLAALDRGIASGAETGPIVDRLDLMVLVRIPRA